MSRAQSVISEIVAHLERQGLLERQTLDYMATMPAWQDHPRVAGR